MFWRCFCSFPKDCLEHAVANLHKKSQLISMLNKKCLCIEICKIICRIHNFLILLQRKPMVLSFTSIVDWMLTRYWLINQIDSNDCEIAVSND